MIIEKDNYYILHTKNTTYCFRVLDTGHLEHLYYGRKITVDMEEADNWAQSGMEAFAERHTHIPGNTNTYDREHEHFTLEDMRLEMSSYGKGDIREPFVELVQADGSATCDFLFEGAKISRGKEPYRTLPGSYDDSGEAAHLTVTLLDRQYGLALELHYYVYEDCDVIARSSKLRNDSGSTVTVKRLLSTQIDFATSEYIFTTFSGTWGREMHRTDLLVQAGKYVNASYTGTSSSRANPFVMLSKCGATEDAGDCYGCNLVYSGNHYEAVEVNSYGKTRFVSGINPQAFAWQLLPGEEFEAPEAVMAFSAQGYNGMSQCMHRFVRRHIVRGEWRDKARPVILNSWEAAYFDINERKLLQLARAGKAVGIELFVMDDGWFGDRSDDTRSLGDWDANLRKLPHGLSGLCDKINKLGLDFGIWVEPEMINVNSRLYQRHPDWVIDVPDKPHAEGRNQRILDLTKTIVQDYIIAKMSEVFSSANIAYVKWDMNRTFSDYYSRGLAPEQQGEVAHRYVLGLYRCLGELVRRFPKILFEGCSAGGNRFDLGILSYFPQIWASDNTDALCRAEIQYGYSYGYPMSTVSAHVSASPNHQTFRETALDTRFSVAAFGAFGYECDLGAMTREELKKIEAQIALYKQWRDVLQQGRFYRGRSFRDNANGGSVLLQAPGNHMEWTCVSPEGGQAVGLVLQKLTMPNTQYAYYQAKGLAPEKKYHFYSGLPGGREDYQLYGDALMYGGVCLTQGFYDGDPGGERCLYRDFDAKLFFMEEE